MKARAPYVYIGETTNESGEVPLGNCIFCAIAQGQIPSTRVYEDAHTLAFHDINPLMPTHVVVIPKAHVMSMEDTDALDDTQLAACLRACACVARLTGIDQTGYRVVSNCGKDACQSVHHLHFHVLGGGQMSTSMA